jgi:uncharacterized membrane protein
VKRKDKTYWLHAPKKVTFEGIEQWVSQKLLGRDRSEMLIILAVLIYTAVFSYFTILKYNAFSSYAWDLGIFNQSFWTTTHNGQLFVSTVEQYIIQSGGFFGTHFSPVLFLVLPFYYVASSPQTLLVAQSLILALGAIPLYFFAKNALNSKTLAVIFSLVYLIYPPLQGVNWFDFHAQAFLPVFFFSAFYFLYKEKWPHYFLFIFLSMSVAENVPITVIFIGLYCFWRYRKPIFNALKTRALTEPKFLVPVVTITVALIWLFLVSWYRPIYYPVNPTFTQLYKAVDNWSALGTVNGTNQLGDPNTLPFFIITHPGQAFYAFFNIDFPLKLLYLFLLFGPLLFLSIRSSIAAICLAWLVPALLSNYSPYYVIGDHFPAYPMAFLFLAAVEALRPKPQEQIPSAFLRRLRRFSQLLSRRFGPLSRKRRIIPRNLRLPRPKTRIKLLLLGSVLFALFFSPFSPVMTWAKNEFPYFPDYYTPVVTGHNQIEQQIVDLVPADASILTINSIFPHFSSRQNAYVYPLGWLVQKYNDTQYELQNATLQNYIEGLFGNSTFVMIDFQADHFTSELIKNGTERVGGYGVYANSTDGFISLYEKGYTGPTITLGQ